MTEPTSPCVGVVVACRDVAARRRAGSGRRVHGVVARRDRSRSGSPVVLRPAFDGPTVFEPQERWRNGQLIQPRRLPDCLLAQFRARGSSGRASWWRASW